MEGLREPTETELLKLYQKNLLVNVLGSEGQQIIVVGDTSTGKSTTINFLLGYPINFEARGIGTRRPCVIDQVQDPSCEEVIYNVNFVKAVEGIDHEEFTEMEEVAQRVADANDANNKPHYFECLIENPKLDLDQAFDMEPIFVTMRHKSFKYGLRLVDLPGLTRKSEGPMEIAKKYIQPGNIAILVMGNDNANNGGFPFLAERMCNCSQVMFIQNFANRNLESGMTEENFMTIKKLLLAEGAKGNKNASRLADQIKFYMTDYGYPCTQDFIDRGQWKEDRDQKNWVKLANEEGCQAVQSSMYGHSEKWAGILRDAHKLMMDKYNFGAGSKEILEKIIEFQFEGIDTKLVSYKQRVEEMIGETQREKGRLEDLVKTLDNPPQWQGLLSKVALVVSEFLDTTIEIPTDGDGLMREVAQCLKTTEEETRMRDDDDKDEAVYGAARRAWIDENTDKKIIGILSKYGRFEHDKPLACLRSWYRLLDELTGMLAFLPMQLVGQSDKLHAVSIVSEGKAGTSNKIDIMVDLVATLGGSAAVGIKSLILHFIRRLKRIVKRDLHNAMVIVAQDKYNAIANFLDIVDSNTPEAKAQLLALIEEVILTHMDETFKTTIMGVEEVDANGKVVTDPVTEKPKVVPASGICVNEKPGHDGALHWLLPFKGHYFNGQIPFKDLRLGDALCAEAGEEKQEFEPLGMPEDPDPELMAEVADSKTLNAANVINMDMFRLCTTDYDIKLDTTSSVSQYGCECMKLLKAMQGEIACFWASSYVGMIQKLVNKEAIMTFCFNKMKTDLKSAGMYMEAQNMDGWAKPFFGDKQAVSATTEYFGAYHFEADFMLNTQQEIESTLALLAKDKAELAKLPSGELQWPGLSNQNYYKLISSEEAVRASSGDAFPRTAAAKLTGQAAWKRLCQEFIYVILQLAMKPVTDIELSLAKASRGKQLMESPQEIVSKLVLHRLQSLGNNGGIVFKHRFLFLYQRMFDKGLETWIGKRSEALGGKDPLPTVAGSPGPAWVKSAFLQYGTAILDKMLGSLAAKFDELQPFDWTTLNGRFPFGQEPLRSVHYTLANQNAERIPDEKAVKQLTDLWQQPLRYAWPNLCSPEDGSGTKFYLETDENVGGLKLDDATNDAAFKTLSNVSSETAIYNALTVPDIEPPNGDMALAGGPFHEMALRVHKSMSANSIDYCRPRLKMMMSEVYQEEHLRNALQRSTKLSYKDMYGSLAASKAKDLGDCDARVRNLRSTLEQVNSGRIGSGNKVEISDAALKAKADKQLAAEQAKSEELASALELLNEKAEGESSTLESLQAENKECGKLMKKYIALDKLSCWSLTLEKISINRLDSKFNEQKIMCSIFYFQQTWMGRDIKTTVSLPSSILPYQWVVNGGALPYASMMEFKADTLLANVDLTSKSKMAGVKMPMLYPPHEHFIAIEVKREWETPGKGMFAEKKKNVEKLCTVVVPYAYALRDKENYWGMLEQVGTVGKFHSLPGCGDAFKMEDRTAGDNKAKTWKFVFEQEMNHFGMTDKVKGASVEVVFSQKQESVSSASMPTAPAISSGGSSSKPKPAGSAYVVGQKVDYYSAGKSNWFPTEITVVHQSDGTVEVALKPGTRLKTDQVRPRK